MVVSKTLVEFKLKTSRKNSNCKQLQISKRPYASYFLGTKKRWLTEYVKTVRANPLAAQRTSEKFDRISKKFLRFQIV